MKSSDSRFASPTRLILLAWSILIPATRGQALPELDAARETVLIERIWAASIPDAGLRNATIFGVILDEGRLRFHGFSFNPMSGIDGCQLVGDEHLARIQGRLEAGVPSYCKLRGTWRRKEAEGSQSRRYRFEIDDCLWVRTRDEIARLHRTQKQLHRQALAALEAGKEEDIEPLIRRCRELEAEWPSDDGRLLLVADALRREPPEAVSDATYVAFLEEVIAQRHLYLWGPAGKLARNQFWKRVHSLPSASRDLLEQRLCAGDLRSWCPYKSVKLHPGRRPLSAEAEGAIRLAEILGHFGNERSRVAITRWRGDLIQEGDAYIDYKREALAHMDACLQRIRSREGRHHER